MQIAEVPARTPRKVPTHNWVPIAFLVALPVCAGIGWLLFLLVGA